MCITRTPKMAAYLLALGFGAAGPAYATRCTDLAGFTPTLAGPAAIGSVVAQDETSGSFTEPDGTVLTNLPPFCRVAGVISSIGDFTKSASAFELWMPEQNYNGRFEGHGNGGFAGAVLYAALQLGVSEGFAAANTDLGTGILFGCNELYCGNHAGYGGIPGGLYQHPAAIRDFGYAATHWMTVAAKQYVTKFYAKRPNYAYFNGCSTGGQQALMESQRFPDDYDGILAGAPAHNRTHLHLAGSLVYEATHFAADAYLPNAALSLIHAHVLKQCAGRDGGLRSDDFLTLPASCKADARALICRGAAGEVPCSDPAAASCTCLTQDQATAMDRDWSGATDDHGQKLYPGVERGSEEPVALSAANQFSGNLGLPWQEAGSEPAFDSLMFWALGPNWVWQELFATPSVPAPELAREIAAVDDRKVGGETFAGVLNANSVDLSRFASHAHKMLMYQGYADPLIPSATSIDYFNAVAREDAHATDYLRLFLAPGVWHCEGGPGANAFGNISTQLPPQPLNPADDVLGALIAWVEDGVPPSQVVATKYTNDDPGQGIAFQRPLCLYPQSSAYVGGDRTKAASFACVPGKPVLNQSFSRKYGP